jgi:hypothetical protein
MFLSASRPTSAGLQQSIAELKHRDFFSTAPRHASAGFSNRDQWGECTGYFGNAGYHPT